MVPADGARFNGSESPGVAGGVDLCVVDGFPPREVRKLALLR
jgi:hypothetical protein